MKRFLLKTFFCVTIMLVFTTILFGCANPVSPESLEKGFEVCRSNGGVATVSVSPLASKFSCQNGATVTVSRGKVIN